MRRKRWQCISPVRRRTQLHGTWFAQPGCSRPSRLKHLNARYCLPRATRPVPPHRGVAMQLAVREFHRLSGGPHPLYDEDSVCNVHLQAEEARTDAFSFCTFIGNLMSAIAHTSTTCPNKPNRCLVLGIGPIRASLTMELPAAGRAAAAPKWPATIRCSVRPRRHDQPRQSRRTSSRYNFRATPPHAWMSCGSAAEYPSGRHSWMGTIPGSTASKPSKKRMICLTLRRRYGAAPLSL